jgi:hypothetical protein
MRCTGTPSGVASAASRASSHRLRPAATRWCTKAVLPRGTAPRRACPWAGFPAAPARKDHVCSGQRERGGAAAAPPVRRAARNPRRRGAAGRRRPRAGVHARSGRAASKISSAVSAARERFRDCTDAAPSAPRRGSRWGRIGRDPWGRRAPRWACHCRGEMGRPGVGADEGPRVPESRGGRPRRGREESAPPPRATSASARSRSPGRSAARTKALSASSRAAARTSSSGHLGGERRERLEERERAPPHALDERVHGLVRSVDGVGDVGHAAPRARTRHVTRERERAVDGMDGRRGRRDVLVGDERVHGLRGRSEAEAHLAPRRASHVTSADLKRPWASTTRSGAKESRDRRSADLVHAAGERALPPARVVAERRRQPTGPGHEAGEGFDRPAQLGSRMRFLEGPGRGQREEDVAEGRQPDEEDAHATQRYQPTAAVRRRPPG